MSKAIDHFKKEAKKLLKLVREEDQGTLQFVRRVHTGTSHLATGQPDPLEDYCLMKAQHTVAVDHGFRCWDVLKGSTDEQLRAAIEAKRAKLKAAHTEWDVLETTHTESVFKAHLAEYYRCSEAQRVAYLEEIERAERERCSVIGEGLPCGEWRLKWPLPARQAILALWRTPRDNPYA